MTIQRPSRALSLVFGQSASCRSVASIMILILIGLPAFSGAQLACQPDGDVDQSGIVTAADALLAFQQALSLVQLDACRLSIADVFPLPATPDGSITASDALCIFQKALGLPSCLDTAPPSNQPPVANAGFRQAVNENEVVTLSGSGSDPDGTIVGYQWAQISGPTLGADTPSVNAPDVSTDEMLIFRCRKAHRPAMR